GRAGGRWGLPGTRGRIAGLHRRLAGSGPAPAGTGAPLAERPIPDAFGAVVTGTFRFVHCLTAQCYTAPASSFGGPACRILCNLYMPWLLAQTSRPTCMP